MDLSFAERLKKHESLYPDWLKQFRLQSFLTNQCHIQEKAYTINLLHQNLSSGIPQNQGVYFIFASYYTVDDRDVSLDMMTEEFEQCLMKYLGIETKKELSRSGIIKNGLLSKYPQSISEVKGLLYIGSSSDISKRLSLKHPVINAIRQNALALSYPYGARLDVHIKAIEVSSSVARRVVFAIEKQLIDLIDPPLNGRASNQFNNPFSYCDILEQKPPLHIAPSQITIKYLQDVLKYSEKQIKSRIANLGVNGFVNLYELIEPEDHRYVERRKPTIGSSIADYYAYDFNDY